MDSTLRASLRLSKIAPDDFVALLHTGYTPRTITLFCAGMLKVASLGSYLTSLRWLEPPVNSVPWAPPATRPSTVDHNWLRRVRRDHRLEDLRLAVIVLELAIGTGNGNRRPSIAPASVDFRRLKQLPRWVCRAFALDP